MLQKFISKLSPREKKIFAFAAVVVICVLVERLLITPTMTRLNYLGNAIVKEEGVIKSNLRFLANEDQIQNDVNALSSYFLNQPKASGQIMGDFSERIEKLAQRSNVVLAKSHIADKEVREDFVVFTANVEISGDINDVLGFLHSIETDDSLIKVEEFSLSAKKADPNQVQSSVVISKLLIAATPDLAPTDLVENSDTPASS